MKHEKLMELSMKSEEIKHVKETLFSWLKEEVNGGKDCFHVESAGQVTDMIKDLAKTEKDCAEAMYYMVVIEAMLEGEEPSYGEGMGYNHRHLNNGRFASTGRGHMVSGFHHGPFMDQEPYIDAYVHDPNRFKNAMMHGNMGYDDGMSHRDGRYNGERETSKHGRAYEDYKEARRHYTASQRPEDKERMEYHAMTYVDNALEGLQELWESSDDTMLKKRIVDDATKLVNQMKTGMTKV